MSSKQEIPPKQQEILEAWETAITHNPEGTTVSIAEEDKRDVIRERTDAFLAEPSAERFTKMWRTGYTAGQVVAPTPIPDKWTDEGRSIDELADLIQEITTSETYNSDWEDVLAAPGSTREFFGWHHANTHPIINAKTRNALEIFDVPAESLSRTSFENQHAAYEDFRDVYEEIVGHATAGTNWEVPLNIEVYVLCVCIDRAHSAIEEEQQEDFKRLYQRILDAEQDATDEDESSVQSTEELNEYWQETKRRQQNGEAFLADPSRERFEDWLETFPWFVSRYADMKIEQIFAEMTPETLAATLEDAADTASLSPVLEFPGFGMATATEALAALNPDQFIVLNNRATNTLADLNYSPPDPNTTSVSRYQDFVDDVDDLIGQHDLRDSLEDVPDWATDYQVAAYAFHKHRSDDIDLAELLSISFPPGDKSTDEAHTDFPARVADADFYWVNQNREVELKEEFLRSQDQKWQRDLTVLETGDIIFHYMDQAIRACSIVTAEAYQTEMEGGEYYRVDVTTTHLDEPLSLSEIRESLQDPELKQDLDRYPLDKNGDVIQAYLCHLTAKAGKYVLAESGIDLPDYEMEAETNYFWVTANPKIKSISAMDDGEEISYTAYNDKGNKKRLFGAFTSAVPGDRVLFYESRPVKEIVAEGTVIEGFDPQSQTHKEDTQTASDTVSPGEVEEPGVRFRIDAHLDGISWNELTDLTDLEDSAPIRDNARGSLFPLTESQFDAILALEDPVLDDVSQEEIDHLAQKLETPPVSISIPDDLYFEEPVRLQREIEASLHSGKHIIFTGPPGTGKTKLAKAICRTAKTYDQVDDFRFTTATSEWTAFDTIGGYVPSTGDGGQELEFEPRLFLKCFRQDRIVNEWLIIDEINRSDIDKAFGQLFSVLSGDTTELPYERDRTVKLLSLTESTTDEELADIIANPDAFPVTPSWRLIATMNTYDKTSLYEMSYAFMRRFNFVHIGVPPLTTDDGTVRTSLLDPDADANYATAWVADNDSLRPTIEEVYPVVAVLWQRINDYRVIGPSIVYDILRYLHSYDDTDAAHSHALTSAVVSLVYPQLEGMRPEQQQRLIRSLTDDGVPTQNGPVDLPINGTVLQQKAADFFGISFDDDA